MNKLEAALDLVNRGLNLFPVKENSKTPAHKGWQEEATSDRGKIAEWFGGNSTFNIGVSTENLIVVDVDVKGTKRGDLSILALEMAGFSLPDTFSVSTPTGGIHLYYGVGVSLRLRGSVEKIGTGIDTRSCRGYCVGAGSVVGAGEYRVHCDTTIAPAPTWLIDQLSRVDDGHVRLDDPESDTPSLASADLRGRHYLREEAELAIEGSGGDHTTFKVAAHLKDIGCSRQDALNLMLEEWNERCQPPWNPDELATKVDNAFRYGDNPQGVNSPEADFDPVPDTGSQSPYDKLNKEFAYAIAGGKGIILWEDKDEKGDYTLRRIALDTFHQRHAAITVGQGKKAEPLTKLWMSHPARRSYDGIIFSPEKEREPRFFNIWRGFSVKPYKKTDSVPVAAQKALDSFKMHLLKNVCNGDADLCRWLTGFFAHLVQKPWEKPLVAVVLKGGKGTGKSVVADTVGGLLGDHYFSAAKGRFITSNFNEHLENCLLFAVEEAAWAGDKSAEGTLKDLITGRRHTIEHKGLATYRVDNLTRVMIMGNDDWVAPASNDERRFAVFNVGDGNQQDGEFFESMARGMENGGYRLLIDYLAKYDLTGININRAPNTKGLLDQKIQTLEPIMQWWHDCLHAEVMMDGDFGSQWPEEPVTMRQITEAVKQHFRRRNINSRVPSDEWIGRKLKAVCPGVEKRRLTGGGYTYNIPSIQQCRADWEKYLRQKVEWTT